MATKWPILEDVYALPRINKEVDSQGQHVFLTEELASNVSLIDFQASNLDRRPSVNRVTRIRELLTVDFMAQDGGHQASYGQNYHYSTNYRVFEGIVGGSSDANLLLDKVEKTDEHASVENSGNSSGNKLSWRSLSFDEFKAGNASARLKERGINISSGASITPLSLLPHAMALQLRYAEHHTGSNSAYGRSRPLLTCSASNPVNVSLPPHMYAADRANFLCMRLRKE